MKIAWIGARGVPARGDLAGGIENYMEELGSRLVVRGHDLTVYCRSFYTKENGFYRGMRLRKLPTFRTKHLEAFVHTLFSSMDTCFKDFDVVQFHALGPSAFSWIPRFFLKKTVASVRGLDWKREKWGTFATWYLRWCEYFAAKFPTRTSVVSPVLKTHFEAQYGIPVTFIPNGFRIPVFREPDQIRDLGLKGDDYLLFVGRIVPEKGCHLLIDAFKDLKTDKKLVFAGEASYTQSYSAGLKAMSKENVLFLGRVGGALLEELYTNAYLFVLPSTIEGLSNALLEAMSYGLCSLTSDIPENKMIVQDVGVTFECGNRRDLKEKLQGLLDDGAEVAIRGTSARAYVQENYSWDRIAALTERFYEEILGRSRIGVPVVTEGTTEAAPGSRCEVQGSPAYK